MGRLQDRVAVILGAASKDNMGQVMARRFAAEGAKVLVAGRSEAPLRALAEELGGRWATCDITRKDEVEALAQAAIDAWGKVDVAVNCTGWGLMEKLVDTTEAQIDRLMDLQFKGTYFFLQTFCPLMGQHGGGSVIVTTSASVECLLFNHAAYIGTKAGGDALMRCFANEFGAQGVKVNSLAPGLTATPMTAEAMNVPGLEEAFLPEYPLGRIGTSEDIANAALWLATDESFVTGQVLQINGGLTLRRNPFPWEINQSIAAAAAKAKG
ncbi:MAG: SDR family oxidoreductase [Gammaproteobacteria bacterium]|nr:MAG: SDR family oxidoreductase [Gammaproteobacteria bacterium]